VDNFVESPVLTTICAKNDAGLFKLPFSKAKKKARQINGLGRSVEAQKIIRKNFFDALHK
jgi:hypothetical protein